MAVLSSPGQFAGAVMWAGMFLLAFAAVKSTLAMASLQMDAEVLLDFKTNVSGQALQDWDPSTAANPCGWTGVTCNLTLQRVVGLDLSRTGLMGTISPRLGDLQMLNNLNLSRNNLTGSIPPSLGRLSNLNTLALYSNILIGNIPTELSNCSALLVLDLSRNKLNGTVPPELGVLSELLDLDIGYNNFTGTIPASLANLTKLLAFGLYGNYLKGSIPPELGALSQLEAFTMYYNNLTGNIPLTMMQNCTNMQFFHVEFNNLSGTIPPQLQQFTQLKQLWIDGNNFTGSIPPELGNFSQLTLFDLGTNSLTGSIPASLGRLTRLTILFSIADNALTGSIPPELAANFTNLQVFKLKGNMLNGSIAPEFGRMKSLIGLIINNNLLSGEIPPEIGNCSLLDEAQLHYNQFSGAIPAEIGRLSRLSMLYLHHNLLAGEIPDVFANFTMLGDLTLGYNMLNGSIPRSVAGRGSLVKNFSLTHNQLSGLIPAEIGQMTLVASIDLSNNNLSGSIPGGIGYCVGLLQLNLSGNALVGDIPSELQNLKNLNELDLSANDFSGTIPSFLVLLQSLTLLNLSYNDLVGPIPSTGVFRNLTASSFQGNAELCGKILRIQCPLGAASPPAAASSRKGFARNTAIVLACVGGLCLGLLLCCLLFCFRSQIRKFSPPTDTTLEVFIKVPKLKQLTTQDLWTATDGFSDGNIIGTGGFSTVYKGTLPGGLLVAIKKFKIESHNVAASHPSFLAELQALGLARHRNLVRIWGYCANMELKALIMDLMPYGSLEKQLYEAKGEITSWAVWYKIITGVAQGMLYLHHECADPILHCDLKPSNILLDAEMEPHVADFGIARILRYSDMSGGVSTSAFQGTFGYMAPENASLGRLTSKADVYSYGIVLLEVMTGLKPTSDLFALNGSTMPKWVQNAFDHDDPLKVVDAELLRNASSADKEDFIQMMQLGLVCCKKSPDDRPTMREIVEILRRMKIGNNYMHQVAEGSLVDWKGNDMHQVAVDKILVAWKGNGKRTVASDL
ncbi:hypothetical protein O6H91_05G061900 [Diphasiastrum complanatum]|uniref:Uncharacterized protein n=1 Tax=Diphasiastrum complanatum TaxID=34168 RepID=A0ACC2DNU5_DIPCM|nr:hypothetical protein O6H91_05G061900 [Diphasiastrum complanatum]